MGGKHKVANRTKNNVRPSSSGRSAELLGAAKPQFAGFSTMKDTTMLLPGFSALNKTEDLEASLDSNFQLVLKKITKKDSTTKLKGLQEFAELVKNSETDVVKAVLPVWPRFYNVLATDTDNRVREATHIVHQQIVLKVKRNIAPFLKQLMAPWFTSQYDSYPPAASVACQAFKDAFPPNKVEEAIAFCQEEILAYISDNLLVQTAQSLSGKQSTAEEAEAKYERVLIACLQGYYLYLTKINRDQIEKVAELNNDIVSNSKFWSFGKHKVSLIRAAWFKVLAALSQKARFLLEGKEKQVTAAVFGSLDEEEPTVLPHVWEAALLAMSTIDDWWKFVNVDKIFLPKLYKILKLGGLGNATVIYPSLLPILSHLPPNLNSVEFYNNFFENLQTGLKRKNVLSSRSEQTAVATALIECLQYVILKNSSNQQLCKQLIKNHIINTIEWCIKESEVSGCKTIFNQIAAIVRYWSRNPENHQYLIFFFDTTKDLFNLLIANSDCENLEAIAAKQIEFLQSLKHTAKLKQKVKFNSFDSINPTDDDNSEEIQKESIIKSDEEFYKLLDQLIFDICYEYVNYIENKQDKKLFEYLCVLVTQFNTEQFFLNLLTKIRKNNPNAQLVDIYNDLLFKWLKSTTCTKHVVDLIFLLFKFVDEKSQNHILNTLNEVIEGDSLTWAVSEALSYPYNEQESVRNWLRSDKVSNFLVGIVDRELQDDCPAELNVILKLALTESKNEELFINKSALDQIIWKLIDALKNPDSFSLTIDSIASLSAYIATIIYTENFKFDFGIALLLTLFEFTLKTAQETDEISSETLWEVKTAWQDIVYLLADEIIQNQLIDKFASIIDENLNIFDKNSVENLIQVITSFCRVMQRKSVVYLDQFLNCIFYRKFFVDLKPEIEKICKIGEYLSGDLSSPYEGLSNPSINFDEKNILKYAIWNFVKLSVISAEIDDDDENTDDEEDHQKIIEAIPENYKIFADIAYDLTISNSLISNFKHIKYLPDIQNYYNLSQNTFQDILKNLSTALNENRNYFKEKIEQDSWIWCKTVKNLFSNQSDFDNFITDVKNDLSLIHLVQISKSKSFYNEIKSKLDFVGKVVVIREKFNEESLDDQKKIYSEILELRNRDKPQFLYENGNIDWKTSQEIIESIKLLSKFLSEKFDYIDRDLWDFTVISLTNWASNCFKLRAHSKKIEIQAFIIATTNLFIKIDDEIRKFDNANNYVQEWNDLFFEGIHWDLAQLWLYLAENFVDPQNELIASPFLQEFGKVVQKFTHKELFALKSDNNYPKWTKFLKRSGLLLKNPHPTLQLWGYNLLMILIPGLVKIDNEAVNSNTPHAKGLIFEQFKNNLVETHEIVNAMLEGFKLGEDSCRVKCSTDSFTYTFAYLLLWDVLLTLCDQSPAELKYQYADWLRNEDLLQNMLNNIFRLMPAEVLQYSEGKSRALLDLFTNRPSLDIQETCNSDKIEHFVCWLYAFALTQLPALVRQWWTGLDSKTAQIVEKITSIYVSPNLCQKELTVIQEHQNNFKNMTIKLMPTVREVIAIYTVDESQIELVITLPANYPLGGPDVQCTQQMGGNTHKQLMLQFKKCVLHQNGRICDGLSIWNTNLDKKFLNVEECYICFAVLHPGTYQLPKLSCQTCKKKYHPACLYRWFSTSHKSSCPLCRNLF